MCETYWHNLFSSNLHLPFTSKSKHQPRSFTIIGFRDSFSALYLTLSTYFCDQHTQLERFKFTCTRQTSRIHLRYLPFGVHYIYPSQSPQHMISQPRLFSFTWFYHSLSALQPAFSVYIWGQHTHSKHIHLILTYISDKSQIALSFHHLYHSTHLIFQPKLFSFT